MRAGSLQIWQLAGFGTLESCWINRIPSGVIFSPHPSRSRFGLLLMLPPLHQDYPDPEEASLTAALYGDPLPQKNPPRPRDTTLSAYKRRLVLDRLQAQKRRAIGTHERLAITARIQQLTDEVPL